jgi:uncharacterized protein YxeA
VLWHNFSEQLRTMKKIKMILMSVSMLLILISTTSAQTDVFDTFAKNIKTSNVSALSSSFNTTIELGLPNNDDAYSKSQAEMILKDFFSKNILSSFTIDHKGTSGNSKFANGTLETNTGRYKVYILVKGNIIYELRFDKQ